MRRYLLVSGAVAAIVNIVVNAVVGSAVYAHMATIPLEGDKSIAGDTVVGAFLIAFFTLLVVPPAARREVRSGKARGTGPHRLRLPRKWPLLVAIVGGFLSAVAIGIPVVALVGKTQGAFLSHDAFLAFKVGFSAVWGSLSAVLIAALAMAGEKSPPLDDRWSTAPVELEYPFDYVDKGGLAVTSKERGCSGTPTWQLVVDGTLDPDAVRAAMATVLDRYPVLTTRVQSLDAVPEYATKFRYARIGPPGDVYELVDLRAGGDLDAVIREVWNRHCDQFRDPFVTLTHVIERDDRHHLLFRQHHGVADGRAFIELLQDFARYLAGDRSDVKPIGRRGELEPLGLATGQRAWYGVVGFFSLVRSIVRGIVRPLALLVQNESSDYTGENGTVRWIVDDTILERWRVAHKTIGASLNSMLTAAWFIANQRYHRAKNKTLGWVSASLVMETRPREGGFRSFANHLATLEVEFPLDRDLVPADMVRSAQAQVATQLAAKRPQKRLVAERALVAGMPLDKLHSIVFGAKRPAFNINFSNLISLDFPVLKGEGWVVDEVLITTPVTPRNGIVLTVIRYNGRLCFNFNYAASAATKQQVEELAQQFRDALGELAA
ncbi:MAG TPA: WS/DGAT domain-containing protein [Kofleriaceae bacterium]|jgi:hypothetical protein